MSVHWPVVLHRLSCYIERMTDHLVSEEKCCTVHYCASRTEHTHGLIYFVQGYSHNHTGPDKTFHCHQFPRTSLTAFSILHRITKIKQKHVALHHQDLKGLLSSIDFTGVRRTSSRFPEKG